MWGDVWLSGDEDSSVDLHLPFRTASPLVQRKPFSLQLQVFFQAEVFTLKIADSYSLKFTFEGSNDGDIFEKWW